MSIRRRISVLFLIVFIINLVGIYVYSILVLPEGVNEHVVSIKEEINGTVQAVMRQLEYSDDFEASVDESVISDDMLIYIEDIDGQIVYTYPDETAYEKINKDSDFYVTASEKFLSTNSNGQQIYFIKGAVAITDNSMTLDRIPSFMNLYLSRMISFEAILFTIAMIIVIFVIGRVIIIPIEKLTASIRGYKKNVHITESDEKNELKALNKDFEVLAKSITEEQEKQTRIIASVSHDIKTPLTSIMGYAEQLKKDEISVERKNRYVNTIYEKSIAIKKMIEGLDDYLTYNESNSSSEKVLIPVKQLLVAVDSYYRDDLEREDCDFSIDDQSGDSVVVINKADMLRVFGNIISNSTKHRTDEKLKIHIEAVKKYRDIEFRISDNGEGVEEWQLKKIFEPLYTTDESRSKSVSGLGLSISKDIVESHQGRMYAEKSQFETGLSIVFSIPVANKKN
ncbi:MAG: HAMP domain-containing histidine kinase [Ruminococcaceae bacterium]|nr:HAMP domain-containing histidine kinase [Oscillospiraceae bacterium]